MTDEPDINKEVWDRLWALWEKLDRPASYDIPVDALTLAGIGPQDYNEWRLAIEDEKRREQELLADAAGADARDAGLREQGMEPMPPKADPGRGRSGRATGAGGRRTGAEEARTGRPG
jgi:hypothetical protein